ncbi:MAG: hypothetical protein HRT92_07680 [Piscirickettsiaceae bacterium]|nr:hypothetical protein [Piscirickettsiaceae bacterium]
MKSKLQQLSEMVAKAIDVFESKSENIDTIMGIIDKSLRNQGMKADAITIDCIALDKKIVILLHDDEPDEVDIALGNKEGDIYSSSKYQLAKISETVIVGIMEVNFIS